jgi:hypothetical protein
MTSDAANWFELLAAHDPSVTSLRAALLSNAGR